MPVTRGPGHTGTLIVNLKKKVSLKGLIGQWMGGEERMWAGQMEGERKQQRGKVYTTKRRKQMAQVVN